MNIKLEDRMKCVIPIVYTEKEISKMIGRNFKYEMIENNENAKCKLNDFLFCIGYDTTYKIELECGMLSRNRFKEIDDSCRIVGKERRDKEWMSSNHCSFETKIYTKDVHLNSMLNRMTR